VHHLGTHSAECSFIHSETDKQDIVGFYKHCHDSTLMINDSAEICKVSHIVEEKIKLKFKYDRVRAARLTVTERPRLVMQADSKQIAVYEHKEGNWTLILNIPDFTYTLRKAIGTFIIAEHAESNSVKLFETSQDLATPIKTEKTISSSFRPKDLDTSSIDQMSLLVYTRYGRVFRFMKMKMGKVVFHSTKNYHD
jgi:hypothetical protein